MLVGHRDKEKIFKRLIKEDSLAHGYLFFGEEQVGKRTFALSLANLIEKGEFAKPEGVLSECMVVSPAGTSIGIGEMRQAKQFLSQKPILSPKRIVVIDDAHKLTTDAQNAILKITEEPPQNSLIILVSPSLDALLGTLGSRLQRIYFPRVSSKEMEAFLKDEAKLSAAEVTKVVRLALGRPGRALSLLEDPLFKRFEKIAHDFIKSPSGRKETIKSLTAPREGEVSGEVLQSLTAPR